MAELVLRAGFNDHLVVNELLTNPTALAPRHSRLVRRLVVDATAVVHTDLYAKATAEAGTQLLIDPQTAFLTTTQGSDDTWAHLPFATPAAVPLETLRDPAIQSQLARDIVEFELDHGATAIIPPYIHLTELNKARVDVALALIERTRRYLDDLGFEFDLIPLVSTDLRAVGLEANAWEAGLGRLLRGAARRATGPVALGLSATSRPSATSLHKSSRVWRRAAGVSPFIAWHAGDVGLLAATMGAVGYEVGMCTAERHDVRSQWRNRAPNSSEPGPRYTGVYVDVLGHSLSKSTVTRLSQVRAVQGDLSCTDTGCCDRGFASMLGPQRRQHAVRCRLSDLEELNSIGARGWRLHHLATRAAAAASAAGRIRAAADALDLPVGAYPVEHLAMRQVALGLRETARIAIA